MSSDHVRRIVNEKIIEIDPEGRIEFQKEKCEKRVFDRRDDEVFWSKMVAHFSLTIENIKRARENKLEKYLRIVFWESLNAKRILSHLLPQRYVQK